MSNFYYDTSTFRQGLIGLIHDTVKDPGERDNLIALVGQYGDACRMEGFRELEREIQKACVEVRDRNLGK